jgi:hypothetical protein
MVCRNLSAGPSQKSLSRLAGCSLRVHGDMKTVKDSAVGALANEELASPGSSVAAAVSVLPP